MHFHMIFNHIRFITLTGPCKTFQGFRFRLEIALRFSLKIREDSPIHWSMKRRKPTSTHKRTYKAQAPGSTRAHPIGCGDFN